MLKKRKASQVQGDLQGGIVAALTGLPACIAFGLLAFEPLAFLDEKYLSYGVLAGMYGNIFLSLLVLFFKGIPALMSGPHILSALIISSLSLNLLLQGNLTRKI